MVYLKVVELLLFTNNLVFKSIFIKGTYWSPLLFKKYLGYIKCRCKEDQL